VGAKKKHRGEEPGGQLRGGKMEGNTKGSRKVFTKEIRVTDRDRMIGRGNNCRKMIKMSGCEMSGRLRGRETQKWSKIWRKQKSKKGACEQTV